jgi:PTH1 family peptidyl-tRNA hydrolase
VVLFLKGLFRFFRRRDKQLDAEYMVFGIGNIGRRYHGTRHNVGFAAVNQCIGRCSGVRKVRTKNAEVLVGIWAGKKIAFVKPLTFVNRCGPVFSASASACRVPLGSCIVVVDDYNLPLGTMRFRRDGSDGGHKGLKSIIQAVGESFPRLRIGIGPRPHGVNTIEFVLGRFSETEKHSISLVLDKAADGIAVFATGDFEKAASAFNRPIP